MLQDWQVEFSYALTAVEESNVLEVATLTVYARPNDGGDTPTDSTGWPNMADLTPIPGLSNIPCMIAPFRMKPDVTAVSDMATRAEALAERHCVLDGFYPAIKQRDFVGVTELVSGLTTLYQVMAPESDSQQVITRLALRFYTR